MAKSITGIDELRDYVKGVVDRADHHAQNVTEVSLAVAGCVVWRKDDGPIKVMTRNGEMTNVLWFHVNRRRYAMSYKHATEKIELRQDSLQGEVVASFWNQTTNAEIWRTFAGL